LRRANADSFLGFTHVGAVRLLAGCDVVVMPCRAKAFAGSAHVGIVCFAASADASDMLPIAFGHFDDFPRHRDELSPSLLFAPPQRSQTVSAT
jgi:hypothetical protein